MKQESCAFRRGRFKNNSSSEEVAQEIACMKSAADAGYGPKLYLADAERGILVMDYIPSKPIPLEMKASGLAKLAKQIHAGPAYPQEMSVFDKMEKALAHFSLIKMDFLPQAQIDKLQKILFHMRTALEGHSNTAPCHRDLNPRNILFTGDRFFAIDYGCAAQDDLYFDLATLVDSFRMSAEQEEAFFSEYLGRPSTFQEKSKLFLMKQAVLIYFALGLIRHVPEKVLLQPMFSESQKLLPMVKPIAADFERPAYKLAIASLLLRVALLNVESPQYQEAIRALSGP